ncbi:endolytic transglycosylase MltG [Methylobacterium nodulans]|uniref:Endolytic murein transglycosylase n=1 Tax=Methylobacterium nodulans (strain LMG 21967 / CNCM I-2342 / ORS 2060) TaxID=460265 RepID=B8IFK0_METNO|nr:endolytic transglycosylase MltG [Methylobacterium nodulans]ACL57735.1 aminodeoxychorismate lyase [Methylobacterium nodulans ORS 2060]
MFRKRKTDAPAPSAPDQPAPPGRLAPRSPSEAIKPTAAPPPPAPPERERGGLLSAISGFLTLFAILGIGAMLGIVVLDRQVNEPGPLLSDKIVVVPPRSSVSEMAELLAREGVIEHPSLFELTARFARKQPLKAGEFNFKAHASIDDVIDTLIQGRPVQHAITFPEGLTSEQIVARLNENDILTGDINETPPEGSLLPDTYKFERGDSRQKILNLMRAKQREVLNQVWSRRSAEVQVRTPQELVTLASIVEKETGRADERPRVAGVFVNRLQKRMRLQSDPTIVYGLVGGRGTLGRGILRSEIERPTPYNTYVIEGLPPGPIANPGRAALEAVANPSRTKELYFVADGTGGHVFAETLDAHNRNVARWRQVERAKAATDPAAATPVDKVEPAPAADPSAAPATRALSPSPMAYDGVDPNAQRSKAFDASEGTARDPLRNKTYDLTFPKTVPVLRNP